MSYVTQDELNEQLGPLVDKAEAVLVQIQDMNRRPSKAHYLGTAEDPARAAFDNAFGSGDATGFFSAVAKARSRDYGEQAEGQRLLDEMGSRFATGDAKATLGSTDPAGGYLIPNNVVAAIVQQAATANPLRQVLTVITGIRAGAIDIPQEPLAPSRAVIAAWGSTKENKDFTTANYTATLYTLAKIYDVSNQLLRQSAGAAEQLIRSALVRSFAAGEAYYILNGSGTSEPKGLLTSLTSAPAAMTTSHTGADNTVAGSVRAAFAKAIEALASRNFDASAVLMNPGDLAHAAVQGTDTAGFFDDETGRRSVLGIPIVTSTAIASKSAVVGDFRSATLFVGDEYRVDVSSEANDRWDKNLTGFRAEEEIGFNADASVLAGAFQRITGLIP